MFETLSVTLCTCESEFKTVDANDLCDRGLCACPCNALLDRVSHGSPHRLTRSRSRVCQYQRAELSV